MGIEVFIMLLSLLSIVFFPGILFKRFFERLSFSMGESYICVVFVSLGFWIILPYFVSLLQLPLSVVFFSLQLLFILFFIFLFIKKRIIIKFSCINYWGWLLFCVSMMYFFAFLLMDIPPGADSSMHGYISHLVLYYNGLPESFKPLIPYDNFSSYSPGINFLTAYISCFNETYLLEAFKITSTLPYALVILASYYLLKQFYNTKVSVLSAIIPFMVSSLIQGSIGWGGNSTVLAYAFCIFSAALLYKALVSQNRVLLLIDSVAIAASPLIHVIPAVGFIYLVIFGIILFLIYNSSNIKSHFINGLILCLSTLLLLMPFILKFQMEGSEELITMIKNWQQEMTGNKYNESVLNNVLITFDRINVRVTTSLMLLGFVSITFIILRKRWEVLKLFIVFFAVVYILFINSYYWFLPMSEIIYPERIVFYMIIIISFLWAEFLKISFEQRILKVKRIDFVYFIIFIFSIISVNNYSIRYLRPIVNNPIVFNDEIKDSYNWVINNSSTDDLVIITYWDSGLWIPALTMRSVVGGHMHFIHHVEKCEQKMLKEKNNKYLFVTKRDMKNNTPIVSKIGNNEIVFQNKEVLIYLLDE